MSFSFCLTVDAVFHRTKNVTFYLTFFLFPETRQVWLKTIHDAIRKCLKEIKSSFFSDVENSSLLSA